MNPQTMTDTTPEIPRMPSLPGDRNFIGQLGTAMIPFTPVSFYGPDMPYAMLRLVVYGSLAYMSWGRYRKLSYAFCGAAGICATTSLLSDVWKKQNGVSNE